MPDRMHVVCLDAPAPPNYGGAIDMYFKIRALATAGIAIHLHYFNYNNSRGAGELQRLCATVHDYPRKKWSLSKIPYIISTRTSAELANRLNSDPAPVLLEGLHCTGLIPLLRSKQKIVVRMHNHESEYYHRLAETEINFLKKTYFRRESRLLRHYESNLDRNTVLACLSQHDYDHYTRAGFKRCHFIPTFLPWQVQTAATGKGSYCLYHGNMAVSENRAAAAWLVRDVFAGLDVPFIIAGNGLTEKFIRNLPPNVTLVASPSVPQLEELIEKAQVNVLPSLNKTGVKLKLLHALYKGRFCVSNPEGILGSGISKGILLAREPSEFRALILRCMNTEFMEKDRLERKELNTIYDNAANASKLSALLW